MESEFGTVLEQIHGGALMDEAASSLAALVKRVQETGKAGTLTLTLQVKANGQNAVYLVGNAKNKLPAPERGSSLFYVDGRARLTRKDPRQMSLDDLQVVESEA